MEKDETNEKKKTLMKMQGLRQNLYICGSRSGLSLRGQVRHISVADCRKVLMSVSVVHDGNWRAGEGR